MAITDRIQRLFGSEPGYECPLCSLSFEREHTDCPACGYSELRQV